MNKEEIYKILNEAYFSENPHEADSLPAIGRLLEGTTRFLDVGASLGQFTRLASRALRKGTITSIEADPIRFEELKRNCERWSAESGNRIIPIHGAASDKKGTIRFYTTQSNVSGAILPPSREAGGDSSSARAGSVEIEVPALTIDDVCADNPPDIIKMDIEGAEFQALQGASRTLARKQTRLLVEIHSFPEVGGPLNVRRTVELMRGLGYDGYAFFGKTLFVPSGTLPMAHKLRIQLQGLVWKVRNRMRRK